VAAYPFFPTSPNVIPVERERNETSFAPMQISASSEQDHSPGIFVNSQRLEGFATRSRVVISGASLGCWVPALHQLSNASDQKKKESQMVVAKKVCKACVIHQRQLSRLTVAGFVQGEVAITNQTTSEGGSRQVI
jgi:hypothetical protein